MGHAVYFALVFVTLIINSSCQGQDPIKDFCHRFAHQTAVIDRRLYIDGGLINYGSDVTNYTNTVLLYADLDVINNELPQEYEGLMKEGNVPSVQGGILWADTVNKFFYLYGGEFSNSQVGSSMVWAYDVLNDTWNATDSGTEISRVSFGAGVAVDNGAHGYYYGGWLSNASVLDWSGGPMAMSHLLIYDMIADDLTNVTGPDPTPRAEGVMVYIPISDAGMLVYFGGVQTPYGAGNDSWTGVPLTEIYLFDILSSVWYKQTASGEVPDMRRRFCAGVTWAADRSSYNIYIYGGASMPPNTTGFDDVYILTLPSFTWIKWWSQAPDGAKPHHSLTCNVIDGTQMIITGGTFPSVTGCDSPNTDGMHNLKLGDKGDNLTPWHSFEPNGTTYEVPAEIISVVGGGPTGGASATAPENGWSAPDLSVFFTQAPTQAARTATRYIPPTSAVQNSTIPTHTSSPSPTNVGAIAGGAAGGGIALIAVICIACLCLRRRNKKKREQAQSEQGQHGTPSISHGNPSIAPMSELTSPSPTNAWVQSQFKEPLELTASPVRSQPGPGGYAVRNITPQHSPELEAISSNLAYFDQHVQQRQQQQQQSHDGFWHSPDAHRISHSQPPFNLAQRARHEHPMPYYPPPPEAVPTYPPQPSPPVSNIELPTVRSPVSASDQDLASRGDLSRAPAVRN